MVLSGRCDCPVCVFRRQAAELANGTDPKVRAMAEEVIRTQQAEIVKMQAWLAERQATKKGTR